MTEDQFKALGEWVRAEAKFITSEMIGHHPNTISKRYTRAREKERDARVAFKVVK